MKTKITTLININEIYQKLQSRAIHPSGHFDSAGRWYSDYPNLINVRTPSRSYPYSEMAACRTKKYLVRLIGEFELKTTEELLKIL